MEPLYNIINVEMINFKGANFIKSDLSNNYIVSKSNKISYQYYYTKDKNDKAINDKTIKYLVKQIKKIKFYQYIPFKLTYYKNKKKQILFLSMNFLETINFYSKDELIKLAKKFIESKQKTTNPLFDILRYKIFLEYNIDILK